jgi:hypothetical protein
MKILDVFSWLPEKELSIAQIEALAVSLENAESYHDGYSLAKAMPESANENDINASKELISGGRKVCYLLRANKIVAVIGYK